MATVIKEKLKEEEKQMKLALVTKRVEGVIEDVIKAAEHLTQMKKISPQGTKAIEQHLAAIEREEMAGIIKRPAKLKSKYTRLAENRFAALSEEEEEKHGGYSTVTDLYATNKARGNKTKNDLCATNKARGNGNNYYSNMNRANRTMSLNDDEASVGTTSSAETVKRSNIMPSGVMTRGQAWNVIKQRNWVQQTIVDRDRRWCPTNINQRLSPANRVGAINKEYLGKLLDNQDELIWACADSGCTANICIPGTPLKNLRPTSKPIRLKTAVENGLKLHMKERSTYRDYHRPRDEPTFAQT